MTLFLLNIIIFYFLPVVDNSSFKIFKFCYIQNIVNRIIYVCIYFFCITKYFTRELKPVVFPGLNAYFLSLKLQDYNPADDLEFDIEYRTLSFLFLSSVTDSLFYEFYLNCYDEESLLFTEEFLAKVSLKFGVDDHTVKKCFKNYITGFYCVDGIISEVLSLKYSSSSNLRNSKVFLGLMSNIYKVFEVKDIPKQWFLDKNSSGVKINLAAAKVVSKIVWRGANNNESSEEVYYAIYVAVVDMVFTAYTEFCCFDKNLLVEQYNK